MIGTAVTYFTEKNWGGGENVTRGPNLYHGLSYQGKSWGRNIE